MERSRDHRKWGPVGANKTVSTLKTQIITTDHNDYHSSLGAPIPNSIHLRDANSSEIIEHIKNVNQEVPIIVLSTSTQEDIITDAFEMGVDDFITKPFSPSELSLRVKRTLAK